MSSEFYNYVILFGLYITWRCLFQLLVNLKPINFRYITYPIKANILYLLKIRASKSRMQPTDNPCTFVGSSWTMTANKENELKYYRNEDYMRVSRYNQNKWENI